MTKRNVHDGIVGAVLLLGLALAHYHNPAWLWLPTILGALLVQSAFTGFCPVYFVLDRVMKDKS